MRLSFHGARSSARFAYQEKLELTSCAYRVTALRWPVLQRLQP